MLTRLLLLFVGSYFLAALPACAAGQSVATMSVAAHRPTSVSRAATAPVRWEGRRACASAVGRNAIIGSVVLGSTFYVLGRNITADGHRRVQGALIGLAGGAAIGTIFALSATPCWPWG